MKVKTSELKSGVLRCAVALAQGWQVHRDGSLLGGHYMAGWQISGHAPGYPNVWMPLTNFRPDVSWMDAGPILDQLLELGGELEEGRCTVPAVVTLGASQRGPTTLIAIARCFVQLKLGDEVDIPRELLP